MTIFYRAVAIGLVWMPVPTAPLYFQRGLSKGDYEDYTEPGGDVARRDHALNRWHVQQGTG
jgi:hypothetical protein